MGRCPHCHIAVSTLVVRDRGRRFRVYLCLCGELGRVELTR
jgi:hypothetical protein